MTKLGLHDHPDRRASPSCCRSWGDYHDQSPRSVPKSAWKTNLVQEGVPRLASFVRLCHELAQWPSEGVGLVRFGRG